MLRRSFSVLVLLSLLGLLMILGYALWNRTAAPDALARSAELLEQGRPRDALVLLNHTDRSLGPTGDLRLRRRLHRLRYRVREQIGRYRQALDDVQVLLDDLPDSKDRTELWRAKIRLLYACGETDESKLPLALKEAHGFLDQHPDDPNVLELAGQTVQADYLRGLHDLIHKDFPVHFEKPSIDTAVKGLLTFLYREPDDSVGTRQHKLFQAELRERIHDDVTYDEINDKISAIRQRIRDSVTYYCRALRESTSAFAALQGYTGMLLRGGRLDEAAVLSWLYLQRFPDAYGSVIAAHRGMDAFLRMNNPALAVETARLWLARKGVRGFSVLYGIDERWRDAYVLYALACHRTRDVESLNALSDALRKHPPNQNHMFPYDMFIAGLRADLLQVPDWLERELRTFCQLIHKSPPRDGIDSFDIAIRLRLDWAERIKKTEAIKTVLDEWIEARPNERFPRVRRARLMLDQNKPWLAARDANHLIKQTDAAPAERDRALLLLLQAREAQHTRDGHGSQALFESLVVGRELVPSSIRDPVLYLGIARRALDNGLPHLAEANLREAAQNFPWSLTLRRMEAELLLARKEDALHSISQVLAKVPGDLAARLLELDALAATEAPPSRVARAKLELITRHPESVQAAIAFAERLLERRAFSLAMQVATSSAAAKQDSKSIAWVRGRALLGLERFSEAIEVLLSVPADSKHRIDALALAVEAASKARQPSQVSELRRKLTAAEPSGEMLRRVARTLVREGFLDDAYELLQLIDRRPDLQDDRDGRLYVLLGRIRHAMERVAAARDKWDAAIPFEDGSAAVPLLALSLLFEKDKAAALDVLSYTPAPVGDPLTLSYMYFLLGDGEKAKAQLARFEPPSELLGTILQQALDLAIDPSGKPSRSTPYPWVNRLIAKHPTRVLEALTLSRGLAFENRSREALELLRAGPAPASGLDQAVPELLWAYHHLLAGRKRQALTKLFQIVHAEPLFFPAYDDLIRLGEEIMPETLFETDMLARYAALAKELPVDLLRLSKFASIWFQGLAAHGMKSGADETADKFLQVARLVAPGDPAPIRMLVAAARRKQDLEAAIRGQLEVLRLGRGALHVRDMRAAAELALATLTAPDATKPDTGLGRVVSAVVGEASAWMQQPFGSDHPPLGAVAVLAVRTLDDSVGEAERAKKARQILETYLAPYLEGAISLDTDRSGISLALEELQALGATGRAMAHVDRLLVVDPSFLELWILRARFHAAVGDAREAIRSLAWIPRLLPAHSESLATLGRYVGVFPVVDQEEARQLRALLEGVPPTPTVAVARALLAYRLGNPKLALQLFGTVNEDLDPAVRWLRDAVTIYSRPHTSLPDVERSMRRQPTTTGMNPDSRSGVEIAAQLRHLSDALEGHSREDAGETNGDDAEAGHAGSGKRQRK